MPIEKQENGKTIRDKIKFIHSVKFMASSLSDLADNFVEGMHEGKC